MAFIATSSILDAATEAGYVVNSVTLGMNIKRIWNGRVTKENSWGKDGSGYRNLAKRSCSKDRILVINDLALESIKQFLFVKHQNWFIASKSFEKQRIILMKREDQIDERCIDGQCVVSQVSVNLLPQPEIMFGTRTREVSMKRVMGMEDNEMSLFTIDVAICFLETATPCFGQPIPDDTNDYYKTPVSNSRVVFVTTQAMAPKEAKKHLTSLSCSMLSLTFPNPTTGVCSCQECSYVFRLFKKRMYKRRNSNNCQQAPHPKCNQRFMARKGLESKVTDHKNRLKKEKIQRLKEEDHVQFVDEDNADLLEVVKNIDTTCLPSQMKLLWDVQMKQLATNSPKGYRWDPRYCTSIQYVIVRIVPAQRSNNVTCSIKADSPRLIYV